jgi:DNA-binding IclR family transcriptional regulator
MADPVWMTCRFDTVTADTEVPMLQTVQKIGPVLDLFTVERPEWGVSAVAEAIGVPRSSAHALLSSLVETGLLQCRARGRYRIGWRIVELSETLRGTVDVRSLAYPVLEHLVARYGETAHLAVLERTKVLYLEQVLGSHLARVAGARVGAQLEPHCGAAGKVLLAHRPPEEIARLTTASPLRRLTPATITDPMVLAKELAAVRALGVALDAGEVVADVHCVAAPVRDRLGVVVASVSLTAPAERFTRSRDDYQRAVRAAASEVSRRLGAEGPPPVRGDPNAASR